ncbi:MAG: thioredoxin-dependent thiol peroxidase [bacterium]
MIEMPKEGSPAPDFTGITGEGKEVKLADYRGKWVVLYFYPADDTPGCTAEACSLRDFHPALKEVNAEVVGVSPNTIASHEKFSKKFGLPFTLIADPEKVISTDYGVYGEKILYGKVSLGIKRTTFLIDPEGMVRKVFSKVNTGSHGQEVLAALKELA